MTHQQYTDGRGYVRVTKLMERICPGWRKRRKRICQGGKNNERVFVRDAAELYHWTNSCLELTLFYWFVKGLFRYTFKFTKNIMNKYIWSVPIIRLILKAGLCFGSVPTFRRRCVDRGGKLARIQYAHFCVVVVKECDIHICIIIYDDLWWNINNDIFALNYHANHSESPFMLQRIIGFIWHTLIHYYNIVSFLNIITHNFAKSSPKTMWLMFDRNQPSFIRMCQWGFIFFCKYNPLQGCAYAIFHMPS